jgi:hypothetical protein
MDKATPSGPIVVSLWNEPWIPANVTYVQLPPRDGRKMTYYTVERPKPAAS